MLPSLATLSLSPVDGRRVARVGAPVVAPLSKDQIARLKALSDAIYAEDMVHRVDNCTQDLKKECVDSSNASSLTIADLEPDILDKIMSTAVLQSTSPCQRITEICRLSNKIKCNPGLYDLLNQRLGWYGEHGSLKNVTEYLANQNDKRATAKSWFLFCCHIYRGYGTWYDFMILASEESEESEEDATEKDTTEEDEATKAAREARKLREKKWYNDWQPDTRQRDAKILGIPTISEMNDILKETTAPSPPPTFEPLKGHEQWILNAVVDSYKRYYVADSIETKITKYFAEITEALDELTDGLTTDQLENIHDGWFNNEPNLLFAIGSFGRFEDFWKKVEDDSKLKRLRKAMERRPTTEDLEKEGMPKNFYRIIYKSKDLAELLREHSASEIKEMSEEIKAMFIAASGVGVEGNQYFDVDCNDVCFDSYCPAYDFMRDLLLTWLRLPQLAGYVFDEGDHDRQGDEAEHFGHFRPRTKSEKGQGRSIFAGE